MTPTRRAREEKKLLVISYSNDFHKIIYSVLKCTLIADAQRHFGLAFALFGLSKANRFIGLFRLIWLISLWNHLRIESCGHCRPGDPETPSPLLKAYRIGKLNLMKWIPTSLIARESNPHSNWINYFYFCLVCLNIMMGEGVVVVDGREGWFKPFLTYDRLQRCMAYEFQADGRSRESKTKRMSVEWRWHPRDESLIFHEMISFFLITEPWWRSLPPEHGTPAQTLTHTHAVRHPCATDGMISHIHACIFNENKIIYFLILMFMVEPERGKKRNNRRHIRMH